MVAAGPVECQRAVIVQSEASDAGITELPRPVPAPSMSQAVLAPTCRAMAGAEEAQAMLDAPLPKHSVLGDAISLRSCRSDRHACASVSQALAA